MRKATYIKHANQVAECVGHQVELQVQYNSSGHKSEPATLRGRGVAFGQKLGGGWMATPQCLVVQGSFDGGPAGEVHIVSVRNVVPGSIQLLDAPQTEQPTEEAQTEPVGAVAG